MYPVQLFESHLIRLKRVMKTKFDWLFYFESNFVEEGLAYKIL